MEMLRRCLLGAMALCLASLFGVSCSGNGAGQCSLVEIAPDKWVPVKRSKFFPGNLKVKYGGQVVQYKSQPGLNAPRSLMEFEGKLYLLAFDPIGKRAKDWRWRCFRQKEKTFEEIPVADYPKSVAIINLWFPGDRRRYSSAKKWHDVDELVLARECDPENIYFANSDMARLWYMLEVVNDFEQAYGGSYSSSDLTFVRQFKAKYKPVRLTSMEMKPAPKKECDF